MVAFVFRYTWHSSAISEAKKRANKLPKRSAKLDGKIDRVNAPKFWNELERKERMF
jgi:hypothetical protein